MIDLPNRRRVQVIDAVTAFAAIQHEPRFMQDGQMFHDRAAADVVEAVSNLPCGAGLSLDDIKNTSSRRFGEGFEDEIELVD